MYTAERYVRIRIQLANNLDMNEFSPGKYMSPFVVCGTNKVAGCLSDVIPGNCCATIPKQNNKKNLCLSVFHVNPASYILRRVPHKYPVGRNDYYYT